MTVKHIMHDMAGQKANQMEKVEVIPELVALTSTKIPPPLKNPQPIVYITVGSHPPSTFALHSDLARFHSRYFAAALRGSGSDGGAATTTTTTTTQTQTLHLPDVEPLVFGYLVEWLYTQRIAPSRHLSGAGVLHYVSTTAARGLEGDLVDLWLLAEHVQVAALQDAALEALRLRFPGGLHRAASYRRVYERTGRGSALRRFVVDLLCWGEKKAAPAAAPAAAAWVMQIGEGEKEEELPFEMVLELCAAERGRRNNLIGVGRGRGRSPLVEMGNYSVVKGDGLI